MKQPEVTLAQWRARVDQELAGVAFERAMIATTPEGLAIQPLYTETAIDPGLPGAPPFLRGASAQAAPFRICMRVDRPDGRRAEALAEDTGGGADALWLDAGDDAALDAAVQHRLGVVVEVGSGSPAEALAWIAARAGGLDPAALVLGGDPISVISTGAAAPATLEASLAALGAAATDDRFAGARLARVSSLPFHQAGADAADELALALSTGALYLGALLAAGLPVGAAADRLAVQVAVGRDTFGELCKLRALRVCWHKLLAAAGAPTAAVGALHAVCSPRTQSQRDPWVNMLRVTTEVFSAALGGAVLVTPLSFDEALGPASMLGRRVARNTALVLREESHLGRVLDAAGGSYYLEERTDALAREAWTRFTALERDGGIAHALRDGTLRDRLGKAWAVRAAAIGKRRELVLGVSEFANLGEHLPVPVPPPVAPPPAPALVPHRDAEDFEALRARVEAGARRDVVLLTLGPPAEHRGRAGYAAALFAAAGLAVRESAEAGPADLMCLCGSDERYAEQAVAAAAAAKAAGARRVVLAGRPGALEAALRGAGVDTFIFVGCDVLATLTDLVGADV